MNATAPAWRPNRRRQMSSWLWLLSAILGAGALWSLARVVHDTRLRRTTVALLAEDKAVEIGQVAAARFEGLAADLFGPVSFESAADFSPRIVDHLAQHSAARYRCRCRDSLSVTAFFRYDASTAPATFDASTERLATAPSSSSSVPDSALITISRSDWSRGIEETRPLLTLTVMGANAVVTTTRPASWRGGTKVYGAVIPTAELARYLFAYFHREIPGDTVTGSIIVRRIMIDDSTRVPTTQRLVRPDTLSLQVAVKGQPVFGSLAANRISGTMAAPPPVDAFDVTVALSPRQASIALLMPVAHDRLMINGLFILCTAIVVGIAFALSRRELLLARARSDFIAGVSHDLRMPLAQILLASETLTLKRDRNDADRDSLTASILREARRLGNMVDNVLLFSRTGAVGLRPHLTAVNVRDLFTEVSESVHLAAADAGQSIDANADEFLTVMADRGLLRQALVNLVDNAIKYGPRGQRIRLTGVGAGSFVHLTVDDEGPGIPRADRARLFEPYERLGRDQTSERTGSGLGLAVVRQIVEACGGHVSVADVDAGSVI